MPRKLPDLLSAYREFTKDSDSPEIFHLWVALGTIAGAAQRKIMMRAKTFDVHTNMFVILTSPPGRAKKGAALRTGKNFLKEVKPEINFASESGSPEAVVKTMSKISNPVHQSITLYSMELGTLMNTKPAEMVDFLTDIWDGNENWKRETITHQTQELKRPWVNIMAGTTPKWLGESIGLIALEGGLTARCIFPFSDERSLENPWPELDATSKALQEAIVEDLSAIAAMDGEFKFEGGKEGEAYRWYAAWYRDRDDDAYRKYHGAIEGRGFKSRFPLVDDPRTASYFDRKHIHLLKVAMILSLSYKERLELTLEDLRRALQLLNATEPGMRKALSAAGNNEDSTALTAIYSQIRANKKIEYKDLLRENYHNLRFGQRTLDDILRSLGKMGRIRYNNGTVESVEAGGE